MASAIVWFPIAFGLCSRHSVGFPRSSGPRFVGRPFATSGRVCVPATLSDWELWACANEVLRQHGDEAPLHVAERIGALALAGDAAGVETWKAIAARVDQLRSVPDGQQPS